MSHLTVDLENTTPEYLEQVRYALTFLSEDVVSYEIGEGALKVVIELQGEGALKVVIELLPGTDIDRTKGRVDQLLLRYQQGEFGMKSKVYFDQRRELPVIDAWAGLLERRWATQVGEGHVILRGPAAQLLALVDHKVISIFGREFRAEMELFPSTILSETLQRCDRSEEHTSELQSPCNLVCRLL